MSLYSEFLADAKEMIADFGVAGSANSGAITFSCLISDPAVATVLESGGYMEYRRRMRKAGSMTTRRREIVGGEVVEGEEFTITWDEIKNQKLPPGLEDLPLGEDDEDDDSILWDED